MSSLEFVLLVYKLCIGISVLSFLVTLLFVVPLQIRKAGVKNGLATLRKKQLAKGFLSLFMSASAIILLSARFYVPSRYFPYLIVSLLFAYTVAWFIKQLIESSIYHTQFSLDQIAIHEIALELERVRERKLKKGKA